MNKIKKTLSLLLILVLLLPLSSCASAPVAITVEKTKFSEKTYAYYLASYKQYWLSTFGEYDTDEFWDSELDGVSVEEYLNKVTAQAINSRLVAAYLFDSYGLKLKNSELKAIDLMIENMIAGVGGEEAFNDDEMFKALGMGKAELREIFIIDAKIAALQDYLYGDEGIDIVTKADRDEYYNNNYFRFKHFYLMNYDYELDSEGKIVYDDDGYAKVKEITDERWEEKLALAEDVLKRAKAGESFDSLISEYSEELSKNKYPSGHYLTVPNDYFADISNAVTAADIGEFVLFESALGVHIIQRIELDEGAYSNKENEASGDFADFEALVLDWKYKKLLAEHLDKVKYNEDITGKYSLRDMPYTGNWYYLF